MLVSIALIVGLIGLVLAVTGFVPNAEQAAEALGIFYTASAGNRGNQHYQGDFNGTAHTHAESRSFGDGDFHQSVFNRESSRSRSLLE